MKRTLTIGRKLTLIMTAMVAVVLALSYFALRAVNSLEATYHKTVEQTVQRLILAERMDTVKSDFMVAQRGLILYSTLNKADLVEEARNKWKSDTDSAAKIIAEFRPLIATDEGRQLLNAVESDFSAWHQTIAEMDRMITHKDIASAQRLGYEKGLPIYRSIGQESDKLVAIQLAMIKADKAGASSLSTQSRWIVSVFIGLCLLVGAVAFSVVRHIDKVLRALTAELGEGAAQVSSAAAEISSSSQSLSQGASEQAATLEETSASSDEISSMIQKNAGTSREVAQNMIDAARQIEVANQSLGHMVGSMKEINASSDKISKIIKVIDEIAFQTNLLALNAAVEAARAGEAGMGFAVVAEEVRSLAQRCAQAAKDTESLIEESIQKSHDGKLKLEQVTAAVASVTESSSKVKVLVDELDLASQEQAKGMQQVASAIVTMEQVTQRNAASAEESASAGEQLSAQSLTLRDMVDRLGKLVGAAH